MTSTKLSKTSFQQKEHYPNIYEMKGLLTRLRIFIDIAENDIIEQLCAYSPNALGVIENTQAAAVFCLP